MKDYIIEDITMFHFEPLLMLRTPMLTYYNIHHKHLADKFEVPVFRLAIENASPSLAEKLSKEYFELSNCSLRTKTSIERYYNRITHRTTPFGLFASFSILPWNPAPIKLCDLNKTTVHSLTDFQIWYRQKSLQSEVPFSFFSNPSIYKIGNQYRYIFSDLENNTQKKFTIVSVDYCKELSILVDLARKPISIEVFRKNILNEHIMDENDVNTTLLQLLTSQIFLTEPQPSVTNGHFSQQVHSCSLKSLSNNAFEKSDLHNKQSKRSLYNFYINTEKIPISGGVSLCIQNKIMDGLQLGRALSISGISKDLQNFKESYLKRFDRQSLPLMEALDPEIGIGYGDLLQEAFGSVLTEEVGNKTSQSSLFIEMTKINKHLLNGIAQCPVGEPLKFNDSDAARITEYFSEKSNNLKLPTGIVTFFRINNEEKVYISTAGANPLGFASRFSLFNPQWKSMLYSFVQNESKRNPGVIFAEIIHVSNLHTANIERREPLRSYEIQMLDSCVVDIEQRILLSDLWINIVGEELVLWSRKHQKRIMPRLDSAYNHVLSDLPVFRFLCDLQYQGLETSFSLRIADLLPGLDYYPRVEYKNSILSLAQWHISKEQWNKHVLNANEFQIFEWLDKKGIPENFALCQGDRQLVFNKREDLVLLKTVFETTLPNTILLEEFPFMNLPQELGIEDESGNPYIGEFGCILSNPKEVYETRYAIPSIDNLNIMDRPRVLCEKDGWVYFKIFCHQTRSNELLVDNINTIVKYFQQRDWITQWFFVRFIENGRFQIRLRFEMKGSHFEKIVNYVENQLSPLIKERIVFDLSLHVYERELERYGNAISSAEKYFHASSEFILGVLSNNDYQQDDPRYFIPAFWAVNTLTETLRWDSEKKRAFHLHLYDNLRMEHGFPDKLYKNLQKKMRTFYDCIDLSTDYDMPLAQEGYMIQYRNRLKQTYALFRTQSDTFIGDMIHMFLNKYLVSDPRKNEMAFHYLMGKYYEMKDIKKIKRVVSH